MRICIAGVGDVWFGSLSLELFIGCAYEDLMMGMKKEFID